MENTRNSVKLTHQPTWPNIYTSTNTAQHLHISQHGPTFTHQPTRPNIYTLANTAQHLHISQHGPNALYNSWSCSSAESYCFIFRSPGFKYWPRDCLSKGFSCSFSGHKATAGTEPDHSLWPHHSTLITTWGHTENSYGSMTSMPCSSCYASLFSVLLYIYLHLDSCQSVHINICTDNNIISSSRHKCCQLFHMCWREIQQLTYREKSWIPPSHHPQHFLHVLSTITYYSMLNMLG